MDFKILSNPIIFMETNEVKGDRHWNKYKQQKMMKEGCLLTQLQEWNEYEYVLIIYLIFVWNWTSSYGHEQKQ